MHKPEGLEVLLFELDFQKGGAPLEVLDLHTEKGEIRTSVDNRSYSLYIFRI
jgi:hypothetical protein